MIPLEIAMNRTLVILVVVALSIGLPSAVVEDPAPNEGTLIVLNKSEATASLIDPKSMTEAARVPTGSGPHEAAVSPGGRIVVVGNYGTRDEPGSTLTIIDVPNAEVLRTIELRLGENLYHRPHGIAFLDSRRVAVTCETERAVLVVDVEAGRVERAVSTDQQISHMIALAPDAQRAFVANIGSGTVTVLDLEKGVKLEDVPTGEGAEGIAVSVDGAQVWVTNRAEDTVTILDTESLEPIDTLEAASFPIRAAFTPDGRHVLVSLARSGEVAVFDAARRSLVRRISMEARAGDERDERLFGDRFGDSPVPIGILIPPQGKRAYVANTNADVVTVIDLERWALAGRLVAGKEPDGMAWSPLEVHARPENDRSAGE
jgi:YVTN family beta-propeller protein